MQILQKTQGISAYTVVTGIADGARFEVMMLSNNQLNYLIDSEVETVDNMPVIYYLIDGCTCLAKTYAKIPPGYAEIVKLLYSIAELVGEIEEYILRVDNICLDFRYIFEDGTSVYKFIYAPEYSKDFRTQIKLLLEELMVRFDNQDRKGMEYLYDFYRILVDDTVPLSEIILVMKSKSVSTNDVKDNTSLFKSEGDSQGTEKAVSNNGDDCVNDSVKLSAKSEGYSANEILGEAEIAESYFSESGRNFDDAPERNTAKKSNSTISDSIANNTAYGKRKIVYEFEEEEVNDIYQYEGVGREPYILDIEKNKNEILVDRKYWIYAAVFLPLAVVLYMIMGIESLLISGVLLLIGLISMVISILRRKEEKEIDKAMSIENDRNMPRINRVTKLIPVNNTFDTITVDSGAVRVGRVQEAVDYCINLTQISRVHAILFNEDGIISIMDQNSTNGTYVNSEKLRTNQMKKLSVGDRVSFAGQEYYCR